jgi:lipoprotein NlpI
MYYSHYRIWLIRARAGERDGATSELSASMKARENDGDREWQLCLGRFLVGDLTESNLFEQASQTAVRPTDEPGQKCEAFYYAGMKRLIGGDKPGALDFLEQCVATGQDNYNEYTSAKAELQGLKKP